MTLRDEVVIRQATSEQYGAVIELRALLLENSEASYACTSDSDRKQWRDAYRIWLRDELTPSHTTNLLVAVRNTQVVGCVTGFIDLRAPGPDCLNGLCGWVQSMVVSPAFRSRGLSRALMLSLMSWFESKHVEKVVLQSTPAAEPLYERIGFRRSSEFLWTWQREVGGA